MVGAALFEKCRVDRVCSRIAAFDIVYAQFIQECRDRDLVLERKLNAGSLSSVAQRGIEEVEAIAGHGCTQALMGGQAAVSWSGC